MTFHAEASGRLARTPERRVTAAGRTYVAAALLSSEGVTGDGYMHVWIVADGLVAERLEALSAGSSLSVAGDSEVVPPMGRRPAGLCITAASLLLLG
jgi:hypothetical protein